MYRVELLQTHGDRKGSFLHGFAPALPEVGYHFNMLADCDDWLTSVVQEAEEQAGFFFFKTLNSSYTLRIIDWHPITHEMIEHLSRTA